MYNACDGVPQCADGSDEAPELGCPAPLAPQAPQSPHAPHVPHVPYAHHTPPVTKPASSPPLPQVQVTDADVNAMSMGSIPIKDSQKQKTFFRSSETITALGSADSSSHLKIVKCLEMEQRVGNAFLSASMFFLQ